MGVLSLLLERAISYPRVNYAQSPPITDPIKRQLTYTHLLLSPQDILTPEEVAARLKVPDSWVYEKTRARCRNPIPCMHLGRYIRFDWNAVIIWLQAGADRETNATRTSLQKER
jgi:Helix-turn-helix domain